MCVRRPTRPRARGGSGYSDAQRTPHRLLPVHDPPVAGGLGAGGLDAGGLGAPVR